MFFKAFTLLSKLNCYSISYIVRVVSIFVRIEYKKFEFSMKEFLIIAATKTINILE